MSDPTDSPPGAEERLENALSEWNELQEEVDRLSKMLSDGPAHLGSTLHDAADALGDMQDRADRIKRTIADILIEWRAEGGTVRLVRGDDVDPPALQKTPIIPEESRDTVLESLPEDADVGPPFTPPGDADEDRDGGATAAERLDKRNTPSPDGGRPSGLAVERDSPPGRWGEETDVRGGLRAFTDFMETIGPPPEDDETPWPDVVDRLEQIRSAVDQHHDGFTGLPDKHGKIALEYAAAMCRHLQGCDVPKSQRDKLENTFQHRLNPMIEYVDCYVHGYARKHDPLSAEREWGDEGTWREDMERLWAKYQEVFGIDDDEKGEGNAEKALNQIREAVERDAGDGAIEAAVRQGLEGTDLKPEDPRLLKLLAGRTTSGVFEGSFYKRLRRALRDRKERNREDGEDEPERWDHVEDTRGSRAVMIGGTPREEARRNVREHFDFESLNWIESSPKKLNRIESKVRSGSTDLVIALVEYMGHEVMDTVVEECRECGVPYAMVESGYGATRIAKSLEEQTSMGG